MNLVETLRASETVFVRCFIVQKWLNRQLGYLLKGWEARHDLVGEFSFCASCPTFAQKIDFIGFGLLSARWVIISKKNENEIKSIIYELQMNCLSFKHSSTQVLRKCMKDTLFCDRKSEVRQD